MFISIINSNNKNKIELCLRSLLNLLSYFADITNKWTMLLVPFDLFVLIWYEMPNPAQKYQFNWRVDSFVIGNFTLKP